MRTFLGFYQKLCPLSRVCLRGGGLILLAGLLSMTAFRLFPASSATFRWVCQVLASEILLFSFACTVETVIAALLIQSYDQIRQKG